MTSHEISISRNHAAVISARNQRRDEQVYRALRSLEGRSTFQTASTVNRPDKER